MGIWGGGGVTLGVTGSTCSSPRVAPQSAVLALHCSIYRISACQSLPGLTSCAIILSLFGKHNVEFSSNPSRIGSKSLRIYTWF